MRPVPRPPPSISVRRLNLVCRRPETSYFFLDLQRPRLHCVLLTCVFCRALCTLHVRALLVAFCRRASTSATTPRFQPVVALRGDRTRCNPPPYQALLFFCPCGPSIGGETAPDCDLTVRPTRPKSNPTINLQLDSSRPRPPPRPPRLPTKERTQEHDTQVERPLARL